ncbi:diguanylate cyclase domain-containing protein [Cellvibrio fontiphilus]|uniref:Diguanylate cyclase domain-containing protein n=1 Tax=Cellvibrio fontiphilus TaxID=1815559 RepID=A0ABV7FEG3_9GAMM
MALFDTVNIIGSTIYFVFAVLLAWLSRIPRTPAGAGCWALAIFSGMCARLSLLLLPADYSSAAIEFIYTSFIMLEKCFLLIGALQFFNLRRYTYPYLIFIACGFLWILFSWRSDIDRVIFSMGIGLFNAAALWLLAAICYQKRYSLNRPILLLTATACSLLALHWLSYPVLRFIDFWLAPGFLIGTLLVLFEYLCLTSIVLLQFQKRLVEAEHHALELAYHDPLTGLNNQRYMNTLFEQALILALRPHQLLALFYIDLDNFKPINDTAGHHMGDEVLKTIAQRLLTSTRSTDICARIGGDEFVVIATQLENETQIQQIAHKLLHQCCLPLTIAQQQFQLGASIGISIYPRQGENLHQLLKQADQAMYQVKKNGKSGFLVFDAGMDI